MFGRLKHISFLLALALSLSFVLPAAAQTDTEKGYQKLITSQTASEFASTHGGSQYADTLTENAAGGGKIICGDSKTVCDGETQFCLRCLRKVKREVLWLFDAENISDNTAIKFNETEYFSSTESDGYSEAPEFMSVDNSASAVKKVGFIDNEADENDEAESGDENDFKFLKPDSFLKKAEKVKSNES